jgi:hypothetical protein
MAGPVILFTRPKPPPPPEGREPTSSAEPVEAPTLGRARRSVNATKPGPGAVAPRTVEAPPPGRAVKPGDQLYALSRRALARRPVPTGAVVLPVADASVIRELAALTADAGAEIDGIRAQLVAMEEQARAEPAGALDAGGAEAAPRPEIGETADAYRARLAAWEADQEARFLEARRLAHGDSGGQDDEDDEEDDEDDAPAAEGAEGATEHHKRKGKKGKKGGAR